MEWWAEVAFTGAPDSITDEQAEALTTALPGFGIAVHAGGNLRLEMGIDAATLAGACTGALDAATRAWQAAYGTTGDPTSVTVMTAAERDRQVSHPAPVDLLGVGEIAEHLGLSRQRAHALTSREGFPDPIAATRAGPVYTRDSVDAFAATWTRAPGRPRRQ